MSWPWYDPSPDEAEEACNYYRNRYNNAANEKRESERQEQNYLWERQNACSQRDAISAEKANLEKRLRGVEEILQMLEGTGGWFSVDVPSAIKKAHGALSKTDSSFKNSIKLSGGTPAASLENAFRTQTVDADSRSASALADFKAEKARLEQEIANRNAQITRLSDWISSLTWQINNCNSNQSSLQSKMNSAAYYYNHYKKYT